MIILDGGIGSEMDRRVPRASNPDPTWCASYHVTNPTVLRQVYEDYASSGAQMLSVNTYSILQYLNHADDDEIQRSVSTAVDIVKDVRTRHPAVTIAGCLSAHASDGQEDDSIRKSVALLATCLARSAVDCILVEMVQSRHVGRIMVEAADTANVPLMIGFSVVGDCGRLKLKKRDTAFTSEVVKEILSGTRNVRCVGVMHSPVEILDEALTVIEGAWDGDLIAYPDCGVFVNNLWRSDETEASNEIIATQMLRCKESHPRLTVVGGCCGLGPAFIRRVASTFCDSV